MEANLGITVTPFVAIQLFCDSCDYAPICVKFSFVASNESFELLMMLWPLWKRDCERDTTGSSMFQCSDVSHMTERKAKEVEDLRY